MKEEMEERIWRIIPFKIIIDLKQFLKQKQNKQK